jgi:hypothetical protein
LRIQGTTADNGPVKWVTVTGHEATPLREGFAQWQADLDLADSAEQIELVAEAEDAAGNIEPRPHRMVFTSPTSRHLQAVNQTQGR